MVWNGTYQYHNCIYNSLPEDEPSSSKLVGKITIKNYINNLQYVQFVGSYFRCYTVHIVELLNYYTNYCIYIKFIKFTH